MYYVNKFHVPRGLSNLIISFKEAILVMTVHRVTSSKKILRKFRRSATEVPTEFLIRPPESEAPQLVRATEEKSFARSIPLVRIGRDRRSNWAGSRAKIAPEVRPRAVSPRSFLDPSFNPG